ncbi:MAG: hypothetical protein KGD65_13265 [Candidatus Lokiarchaeota archaeon]|nr:hypothetical protein [Candidatus Lokiarchaeota archaeon]
MDIKTCRYLDGSGNEYILNCERKITFEYNPVKPLYSSSGIYDGGDYVKKEISEQQYIKILSTLKKAVDNRKILINDRVKGSGMIVLQEKNKQEVYILEQGSKEIKSIEKILHDIIQN